MIHRSISETALNLWTQYPILTITGPRQSGKTTLAKTLFPDCNYVNLEAPDVREAFYADPRGFLGRYPAPTIFDEIQNTPELVSYLQERVDASGLTSQFILTGSHQPALQAIITQSLAGRTALLELLPLSVTEVGQAGKALVRDELLYKGFMPRLYASALAPTRFYGDYFRTYVERDIRQLINLKNRTAFEIFIKLLAGRVGQVLNLNSLANDVGASSVTIKEWLSLLETSYIIYILRPYYQNFGKRFVKSPKVYFVEPGLAAYLLGIRDCSQIATHPLMGSLFENLVVVEFLKKRLNAGLEPDLYYMRTSNGVEVDIVLENAGKLDLYEVKASSTFNLQMAKNLTAVESFLKPVLGNRTVIYAGTSASFSNGINCLHFSAF